MRLTRTEIAGLVPHGGAMCLLDGVQDWDERTLVCTAAGHGDPAHPLRDGQGLRALCGIEYAAQAVALHAALASRGRAAPAGLLASVRDVALHVDRLEDVAGPLTIRVEQLLARDAGALYRFAVTAAAGRLLDGRLSVCWLGEAGGHGKERA